jgi:hypothetical protein
MTTTTRAGCCVPDWPNPPRHTRARTRTNQGPLPRADAQAGGQRGGGGGSSSSGVGGAVDVGGGSEGGLWGGAGRDAGAEPGGERRGPRAPRVCQGEVLICGC